MEEVGERRADLVDLTAVDVDDALVSVQETVEVLAASGLVGA